MRMKEHYMNDKIVYLVEGAPERTLKQKVIDFVKRTDSRLACERMKNDAARARIANRVNVEIAHIFSQVERHMNKVVTQIVKEEMK